jgi:hypothetical protein
MQFFGKPDEEAFRTADVAEPIHVFVSDHFATDELRTMLAEPRKGFVEVIDCEHHAQVAQCIHRGPSMIGDHLWRQKARELESSVAVWRTHHGDLDTLVAKASYAPRPFSLDHRSPFELKTEYSKELDCRFEILDDNAQVVEGNCHVTSLAKIPSRAPPGAPRLLWA